MKLCKMGQAIKGYKLFYRKETSFKQLSYRKWEKQEKGIEIDNKDWSFKQLSYKKGKSKKRA